jgi:1-acylglycerone phosphate reductase
MRGWAGPILDIPMDQAQNVFETNVLGMLRLAQAVFPHMATRKRGTFITIGSIVGEIVSHFPNTRTHR